MTARLTRVDITERQESDMRDSGWTVRHSWDISQPAPYDGELERGMYHARPSGELTVTTVIAEDPAEATAVAREFVEARRYLTRKVLNGIVENARGRA